jgi:hypothetical protein
MLLFVFIITIIFPISKFVAVAAATSCDYVPDPNSFELKVRINIIFQRICFILIDNVYSINNRLLVMEEKLN